jgi:hypothetical protein
MAGKKNNRSRAALVADIESDDAVENTELPVDDGLILVTKGDEQSRIHPSTLASHITAGWRQ